jgi:tetratricopeptide (TPR) repeat protein
MLTETERTSLLEQGEDDCDRAVHLAEQGEEAQALELLEHAENVFGKLQDQRWLNFVNHERFRILQKFGKEDQALALTDKIKDGYLQTRNRHGLSLILIHRANLLHELKQNKSALADLRAASAIIDSEKLNDLCGYLHASLADVLMSLSDFSSSIQAWMAALCHYPENTCPHEYALCLQQIGLCQKSLANHQAAEESLGASLQAYLKNGDQENATLTDKQLRELHS